MTTYNLSANIQNTNVSQSQNTATVDTVVTTLTTRYTPTVTASQNCTAVITGGGSSSSTTAYLTVTFGEAGAYSVTVYQGYYAKTYTLTGTTSGAANYGYGMNILDASGNVRMSTLKRQPRVVGFLSGSSTSSGSFTRYYTGFNTPSAGEWHAVNVEPNSNYFVTQGTSSGSFLITRGDVRSSNASYQVLSGSNSYRIMILRI